MVRVVTLQYEAVHGHKPRQPRGAFDLAVGLPD